MNLFKAISSLSLTILLVLGSLTTSSAQSVTYPCGPGVAGNWGYCGVTSGGFGYLDGPMTSPTTTFSGTSFTFITPAINWIVFGFPVGSTSQALVTAPSATTYWFISQADGTFAANTVNTPPAGGYELAYTVIANGSGITSVTSPNTAILTLAFLGGQPAACTDACNLTLSSGSVTWTFADPYVNIPICWATAVGAPTGTAVIYFSAISISALTVNSTNGADARHVDVSCKGNPN